MSPAVDHPSSAPASVVGGGGAGVSSRSVSDRRDSPTRTSAGAHGGSSSRASPVLEAQDGDGSKDRSGGGSVEEEGKKAVARTKSPATVAAARGDEEDAPRGIEYDTRPGRAEDGSYRRAAATSSAPKRPAAEAATEVSASDAIALASMRHGGGSRGGGSSDDRAQSAARARSASRSPSNHRYDDGEQKSETAAAAADVRAASPKVNDETVKVPSVKSEAVEAEGKDVGARNGGEGPRKAQQNGTGRSAAGEEDTAAAGGGGGGVSPKGKTSSPAVHASPEAVETFVEKLLAAQ